MTNGVKKVLTVAGAIVFVRLLHWNLRDYDDHEEMIHGRMMIGLEEKRKWRMMIGDNH